MARQRTKYGREEREYLGYHSWRYSPDSSEWAQRTPHRQLRAGAPKPRVQSCSTRGWRKAVRMSLKAERWARGNPSAAYEIDECLHEHGKALPRRIEIGSYSTRHRVSAGSVTVTTFCHVRDQHHTTVFLERA